MLFFFLLYIVIFMLFVLLKRNSLMPILFILILLVLFRNDNVGSDFVGYVRLIGSGYYDISFNKLLSWFSHGGYYEDKTYGIGAIREFGFSLYIDLLYSLFNNAKIVINFTVILILMIFIYAFNKIFDKENVSLCLFVYVSIYIYFASFNTLRQSFAVSIIVLSGVYLYLKKHKKAFLLYLIACTIHFTATLILPFILISIYMPKLDKRIIIFVLSGLIILHLFRVDLFNLEDAIVYDVAGRNFSKGMHEATLNYNVYIHYLSTIFMAFMSYVFVWFYSRCDDNIVLFYNLWFIGIVLYILLMKSPNVGRISEYFYAFQIFAIVSTVQKFKEKDITLYLQSQQLVSLYCILWYSFYALRNMYGLQPYIIL